MTKVRELEKNLEERKAEKSEIQLLGSLDIVQKILKVLTHVTGLRIALVARVTDESWTACAVLDEAGFGIQPGDQLELQTTY